MAKKRRRRRVLRVHDADIQQCEREYTKVLHDLLDQIYIEAAKNKWTYSHLAGRAGLAFNTVDKLGDRTTKYLRFLTVYKLARAVGWLLKTTCEVERRPLSAAG